MSKTKKKFFSKLREKPSEFWGLIDYACALILIIIGYITIIYSSNNIYQTTGLGLMILAGSCIVSGTLFMLPRFLRKKSEK